MRLLLSLMALAVVLTAADAAPPKANHDCGCSHRDACHCQAAGRADLCLCDGEPVLLAALADPPACPNCANGICSAPPRRSQLPAQSPAALTAPPLRQGPASGRGIAHATAQPRAVGRQPVRGFLHRVFHRN